jgi:hypothetical protein
LVDFCLLKLSLIGRGSKSLCILMVDLALILDLLFKFINLISQIFDLSVEFSYILVYEMILLLLFQES